MSGKSLLTKPMLWVLLLFFALSWMPSCVVSGQKKCSANTDCDGNQLCLGGRCTSPSTDGTNTPDSGGQDTASPTDNNPADDNNPVDAQEQSQTENPQDAGGETTTPDENGADNAPAEANETTAQDETTSDTATDTTPTEQPTESSTGSCVDGQKRSCYTGTAGTEGVGPCKVGEQTCVGGFWDIECKGEFVPTREECNGKDDDCDGMVDNNINEVGESCQVTGKSGPCGDGKKSCNNGTIECSTSYQPKAEDCTNGIDDDCDGKPDGPPCTCTPGTTEDCFTGAADKAGKGECKKGKRTCDNNSQWGPCQGEVLPANEECNGKDDDCDGQVDQTFPEKGKTCTDNTKKGICQKGTYTKCDNGQPLCTSSVQPKTEICGNGEDDDCDGEIDEQADGCQCTPKQTSSCYTGPSGTAGKGICKTGTRTCDDKGQWGSCQGDVKPEQEECDGKDNDCNGAIDDSLSRSCSNTCGSGTEICKAGAWGACSAPKPTTETCNGKDDDCDGDTDETWKTLGDACSVGKGECKRTGKIICNSAGTGTECSVKAGAPSSEICDGKDNDCDGVIDDGVSGCCNPGDTQPCPGGTNTGLCNRGTQTCSANRVWGSCVGRVDPTTDVCDGKDNDCDGYADNYKGTTRPLAQSCYPSKSVGKCSGAPLYTCTNCIQNTSTKAWTCYGACKTGTQTCSRGIWGTCSGHVLPTTEVCRDGINNDCDSTLGRGRTDEICGPSTYAYYYTSTRRRSLTASGSNPYVLTPTTSGSNTYKCGEHILIASGINTTPRYMSYTCSGANYQVYRKNKTGGAVSGSFTAVVPDRYSGEVWGQVNYLNFSGSHLYIPNTNATYGNASVTRVGTGIIEISSSQCTTAYQPVFATVYSSAVVGYATGRYYTSGKCRVYLYDSNGALKDMPFSYWIPSRGRAAWATVSSSGTVSSSNDFGDQYANWTASRTNTSAGAFSYFTVDFPALNSTTSAALIGSYSAGYISQATSISSSVRVYTFVDNSEAKTPGWFYALFIQ